MKIVSSPQEWREIRKGLTGSVGFVPTMGALHAGHAALLERSRRENQVSVLSIFVNPTQFNDPKDFAKYPVTLEADEKIARAQGVDYILLPQAQDIYSDEYRFKVTENQFSTTLEGAFRPGHFDGVLTVVLKLFNIVQADRAYFGEKDFQQMRLVQDMSKALFLTTEVIACETVREKDGLAMSSRNVRLGPEARKKAPLIAELLKSLLPLKEIQTKLEAADFIVEYVAESWGRRLVAVQLEGVRLIDNVKL